MDIEKLIKGLGEAVSDESAVMLGHKQIEAILNHINELRAYKERAEKQEPYITLHAEKGDYRIEWHHPWSLSAGSQKFYIRPPIPSQQDIRGTNRYGLDKGYLAGKLNILLRDIDNHRPDEAARVLARLAKVADESVLSEPEFSLQQGAPDSIKDSLAWLESALRCENFHWDSDQKEAASLALIDAQMWLDRCPNHEIEQQLPDEELPGMWSNSDLSGGYADSCNKSEQGGAV